MESIGFNTMRSTLQTFLFFMISFNTIYGQQPNALTEIEDFGSNPGNLKMFLHTSSKADSVKVPLVIVLHGCGENAKSISALTGWNKLADINNFVVLYPQQKLLNNPNLCFNWFVDHDIEKGQGESESIFEMITFAIQHYPVDATRIYITGLSAGAAMSVVMMATHPEIFKGGASFAGAAYKLSENGAKSLLGKKYAPGEILVKVIREQNPTYSGLYPALIIYQGLNDPIVNYKNAATLVEQWTGINNSDSIPAKIERAYMGIEDISRTEYKDSTGRTTVVLYEINNLGHRILVKPGEKENEGGQTGIFGVDKGYHSTYQVAREFGIIK